MEKGGYFAYYLGKVRELLSPSLRNKYNHYRV